MQDGEDTDLETLQAPHEVTLPLRRFFTTVDRWTFGGDISNPELQDDGSNVCGSLTTALTRMFKSSDRGMVTTYVTTIVAYSWPFFGLKTLTSCSIHTPLMKPDITEEAWLEPSGL